MIALTPMGASNTQDFIPSVTEMAINNANLNKNVDEDAHYVPEMVAGELAHEFAHLDPSLSAFHGDLRSAAAELASAKKSGKDISIALSNFETAESIYQTRLFEVRRDKLAMDAQAEADADEAKSALHALTMQHKMDEQFAALRKRRIAAKRRQKEQQNSWLFYFLIGLWLSQMQQQRQNDFRNNMKSQMSMRFTKSADSIS